jgi:PEGA domain
MRMAYRLLCRNKSPTQTKAMPNKRSLNQALFMSILFAVLALLASASAYASPKNAVKRGTPSANEAVRRGVDLLAKKDYAGALAAFREAREIEPTAMAAAQIAFVHIGMERWLDANGELEDVLSESNDSWVAAHQAQLKESLATAKQHIGLLRVTGSPQGAQVTFRGEVIGLLPVRTPVQVIVGRAVVRVEMSRFEPVQRQVEIAAGETADVTVSLRSSDAQAANALPATAPAPQPAAPALREISAQAPTDAAEVRAEYLRTLHTYRWVGLVTGTVLLGGSIPTLAWMKRHNGSDWPASTNDKAALIGLASAAAIGSGAMVLGLTATVYLAANEPDAPAHASLRSPFVMVGGRF